MAPMKKRTAIVSVVYLNILNKMPLLFFGFLMRSRCLPINMSLNSTSTLLMLSDFKYIMFFRHEPYINSKTS